LLNVLLSAIISKLNNMRLKLTFCGGVQGVTGSRYLIETNNTRFLVDCGLYQERQYLQRNWAPFIIPPNNLDFILLTHAHLDHCGLIPKLVKEGFNKPIYCTPATAEIAEIALIDAAKLQVEDVEFKKRRHEREARKSPYPEIPLYTLDDAKASLSLLTPYDYEKPVFAGDGIEVTFHDAGHILGSAMIKVKIKQGDEERSVVFSGDIGRWERPILNDPTLFEEADYVLVESTYGDRTLANTEESASVLANVINTTMQTGGNIVIPSFALERAQEVLYHLNQLLMKDIIPHVIVFVDSPMAVSVTDVFEHHPDLFDKEMLELINQGNSPFNFKGLHLVRTIDESKAINRISGTVIIIAGSGMCTGGRIKHHLVANISRAESTILFVGYQAEGTLGRQIVDGATKVRILGQNYTVNARIAQLNGFSSHADQTQLLKWLSGFKKPPKRLFVTHGEANAAKLFANLVRDKMNWQVALPDYRDEIILE
jgi:metallo-beta-lactamase family protein